MNIFQKSIIKRHLNNLDTKKVNKAYEMFNKVYSAEKIQQIKSLKEEEYQDGFLRDLFVHVFGYTLKPDDNYNLVRELKNQSDSKKADGAIVKNTSRGHAPLAVIELKSTKTKDLTSITQQAFNYKNNQPGCKYVITSNFQKLRFYIDYANEYEEFDLFALKKADFNLLYLILSKENVFADLPQALKDETRFHEQKVSENLYDDYSDFKYKIFDNLVKNNPKHDKLSLFEKSQKLLDRLLFIFFAEDSGLLPANSIARIIEHHQQLIDLDAEKPLYDIYKQYFGYMNKGRKGKKSVDDIPAYNGGLFAPDEILDSVTIDDEILKDDSLKLSAYDFSTEVDVNILGHIFEHSLNEIEEINAELAATAATKGHAPLSIPSVSKRKKDGVFYTPKYITQYIVENTLGKLCEQKRKEEGIFDIEFDESYYKKTRNKGLQPLAQKGKELFEKLTAYKDWLLTLKIVDPACGSGAFLNQALNFLITEHKKMDGIIAELTGDAIGLFDTDKAILENNLFGVDINQESVEIAKLSLWLRTARRGRKLSHLNNNIKVGNSLIDDPEIAGEKAFDWEKEFPQVFKQEEKTIWHITTATHNSRYSQRMFDNHVKPGEAVWLDEEDELIITKTVADIVKKDKLNVLAYNICGDHIHLLLVCEENERDRIVGKIKSMTSRARNIAKGYTVATTTTTKGHAPLSLPGEKKKRGRAQTKLWTQKFGKSKVKTEEYLNRAIAYIRNNRKKHKLPENKELQKIIDSFVCTTEHAFRTEYKGGFDVVIGNPPYVRLQGLKANYERESLFYEKNYQSATSNYDIYVLFLEKSLKLINSKGKASFILPHKFLISEFGKGIRKLFAEKQTAESLLHFGSEMVFADASTYTCILNLSNHNPELRFKQINPHKINEPFEFDTIPYDKLSAEKWNLNEAGVSDILEKLNKQPLRVKDVFAKIFQGIATSGDKVYLIKGKQIGNLIEGYSKALDRIVKIEADLVKPMLKGEDISKYKHLENQYFVIFPYLLESGKTNPMTEDYIAENFPLGYEYLKENERFLRGRERGRMDKEGWFLYIYPKSLAEFEQPKIITPDISYGSNMSFDEGVFYHGTTLYSFIKNDKFKENYKFWLSIFNSKIMWFFIKNTGTELRGGYFRFKTKYLEPFPLPKLKEISEQNIFIEKVDQMLSLNKELQTEKSNFLKTLQEEFSSTRGHAPFWVKISKKLQAFEELEYEAFKKELKKKKVKISLGNENNEWREYFNTTKQKINELQSQINKTDKKIDSMVYDLYELTDEEIAIVENSNK